MEFERRKRRHSHIDIAPLVDVVFLLLLFFMLTFNMALDQSISIRLPQSTSAEDLSASRIVIFITREGEVLVQGQTVPLQVLSATLREQPSWRPEIPIHIRSDREVPVGLLVSVIDAVRHSGSRNFQIVTERPAK
uniref:Biopolymer transporter ExbD n=1 Tax=Desulfatirhabdium butyrativorans TaxID=340467 RepID=A0A7C4VSB9_9BACT